MRYIDISDCIQIVINKRKYAFNSPRGVTVWLFLAIVRRDNPSGLSRPTVADRFDAPHAGLPPPASTKTKNILGGDKNTHIACISTSMMSFDFYGDWSAENFVAFFMSAYNRTFALKRANFRKLKRSVGLVLRKQTAGLRAHAPNAIDRQSGNAALFTSVLSGRSAQLCSDDANGLHNCTGACACACAPNLFTVK